MRKLTRTSIGIIATLLAVAVANPASACTGVIVGGDLTRDGSTIFGRTEDLEQNHPKVLKVHPAGELPAGHMIKGSWTSSTYKMAKPSLKFTSISDVTEKEGHFDEAGFNEKGVGVDATVSAGASKKILDLDPYLNGDNGNAATGWEEGELATVLLSNAQTAREAIELMAGLIDKDGMAEGDILVVGDKNELWYMELYSGHQYAAIKYPRDKYAVFPNAFWLDQVNCQDKENTICSAKLEEIPKKAGTYVETNGVFNPAKSYNPEDAQADPHNLSRIWSGLKVLDPTNPTSRQATDFTLFNSLKSGKKIDLAQVMAMQRNRFQGIDDQLAKLSQKVVKDRGLVDVQGKAVTGAAYPVGNTNTMEAHIFQFPKSDMPAAVPGTLWQTIGTPQGSPYLPYYGNITQTTKAQQLATAAPVAEDKKANPRHKYVEQPQSYYWVATAVNLALDKNREVLEKPVKEYIQLIEQPLLEKRSVQDKELITKFADNPETAATWATKDFLDNSEQAFQDLLALKNSLAVWDTDHDLVSTQNAGKLSVKAGQIILPTEFGINQLSKTKLVPSIPKNLKLKQAWDLSLTQKLPNRQTKKVGLGKPATVRIPLSKTDMKSFTDQTKLFLFQSGKLSEIPYQVKEQELSFSTEQMGTYLLAEKTAQPSQPGGSNNQEHPKQPGNSAKPGNVDNGKWSTINNPGSSNHQNRVHSKTWSLSTTGTNQGMTLLLSICLLILGTGLLGYRRYRHSE